MKDKARYYDLFYLEEKKKKNIYMRNLEAYSKSEV